MRRIDRKRREHRVDPLVEDRGERGAVALVELVPVGDANPLFFERGCNVLGEDGGLVLHELAHLLTDRTQHFRVVESVGRACAQPGVDLLLETGDAHLEELVEVRGEDRQELCSLQQWTSGLIRQREHASVELEPRQLAVQVALGTCALVGGRTDHAPMVRGRDRGGCGVRLPSQHVTEDPRFLPPSPFARARGNPCRERRRRCVRGGVPRRVPVLRPADERRARRHPLVPAPDHGPVRRGGSRHGARTRPDQGWASPHGHRRVRRPGGPLPRDGAVHHPALARGPHRLPARVRRPGAAEDLRRRARRPGPALVEDEEELVRATRGSRSSA